MVFVVDGTRRNICRSSSDRVPKAENDAAWKVQQSCTLKERREGKKEGNCSSGKQHRKRRRMNEVERAAGGGLWHMLLPNCQIRKYELFNLG